MDVNYRKQNLFDSFKNFVSLKHRFSNGNDAFTSKDSPEELARKIRSEYADSSDSLAFPVDEFANSLGIDVYTDDLTEIGMVGELAGIKGYLAIKPNNERPVIVVSKDESYGHQRWTVAHELWHYFIHTFANSNRVLSSPVFYTEFGNYNTIVPNSEEDLANRFAAELLMPKSIFSAMYRRYEKASRDPDYLFFKLSNCFKVSKKAVLTRIKDLKL